MNTEHRDRVDAARPFTERALALAPEDPTVLWCTYLIHRANYENREALAALEKIRAQLPDDVPAHLATAIVLRDLEGDEEIEPGRAEAEYRSLLARPSNELGAWRPGALYQMFQLLMQSGRREEGTPYMEEYKRLTASGVSVEKQPKNQLGTLGELRPHTQRASSFDVAPSAPSVTGTTLASAARGAFGFRAGQGSQPTDLGKQLVTGKEQLMGWAPDTLQLVRYGSAGVELSSDATDGDWTSLTDRDVLFAARFDRGNDAAPLASQTKEEPVADRELDLLLIVANDTGAELRLLEQKAAQWSLGEALASFDATPTGLLPVDYDHDGDLDVIVSVPTGPRVFRNDGFDFDEARAAERTRLAREDVPNAPAMPPGALTDVSDTIPFPAGDLLVEIEDVDSDNDVDLVLIDRSGGAVRLLDDLRGGLFEDATDRLPDARGALVACADFDGSSFPDLVTVGDEVLVHR